jgi:hypothetical protein
MNTDKHRFSTTIPPEKRLTKQCPFSDSENFVSVFGYLCRSVCICGLTELFRLKSPPQDGQSAKNSAQQDPGRAAIWDAVCQNRFFNNRHTADGPIVPKTELSRNVRNRPCGHREHTLSVTGKTSRAGVGIRVQHLDRHGQNQGRCQACRSTGGILKAAAWIGQRRNAIANAHWNCGCLHIYRQTQQEGAGHAKSQARKIDFFSHGNIMRRRG